MHPVNELPTLLPATDILISVLPQTPETVGLIGAGELALLPSGAVVVNIRQAAR